MNHPEPDDRLDSFLVFLGTIIIGLGFGLLFTYKDYREYVETLLVVTGISSFLFTFYQIWKKK